jgi:hypothetical protein
MFTIAEPELPNIGPADIITIIDGAGGEISGLGRNVDLQGNKKR